MNCGYIHSAHGCSPHLAWSFCTEVLFTHYYRKTQRKQRSDNDPSGRPPKGRTFRERVVKVTGCSCLDNCEQSESEYDDIAMGQFTRGEDPSRFHDESWQKPEEAVMTAKRAKTSTPHGTVVRGPYAPAPTLPTSPSLTPMSSVMPTPDSEVEAMSHRTASCSVNQPLSSVRYPQVERFAFTPVPVGAPAKDSPASLNSSV